jgi:hypothetical protein
VEGFNLPAHGVPVKLLDYLGARCSISLRAFSTAVPVSALVVRNLITVARRGGYLARASDPPPGNTVIWRGMQRLIDIQMGYELALNRSG